MSKNNINRELKKSRDEFDNKYGVVVLLAFIVVGVFSYFGFSTEWAVNLFASITLSMLLNLIIGAQLIKMKASILKKIFLIVRWKNFKFSISLFVILTAIIKYVFF